MREPTMTQDRHLLLRAAIDALENDYDGCLFQHFVGVTLPDGTKIRLAKYMDGADGDTPRLRRMAVWLTQFVGQLTDEKIIELPLEEVHSAADIARMLRPLIDNVVVGP